jgi:hypothetical protein
VREQGLRDERGQALLELLLVIPLFIFITGAIIGMGWAYWVRLNQTAYAQEATAQAGRATSVAQGRALAARFSAATNVDLDGQSSVLWLAPYRGVRAEAHYQAPALLLHRLRPPEIQAGSFFRWERFYGGPPDPGAFE